MIVHCLTLTTNAFIVHILNCPYLFVSYATVTLWGMYMRYVYDCTLSLPPPPIAEMLGSSET